MRKPFGMRVANLLDPDGSHLLVVEDMGGPALEAGIQKGDCILMIDGEKVEHDTWADKFRDTSVPFEILFKKTSNPDPHPDPNRTKSQNTPNLPVSPESNLSVPNPAVNPNPSQDHKSVASSAGSASPKKTGSIEAFLHRQLQEVESRANEKDMENERIISDLRHRFNHAVHRMEQAEDENIDLREQLSKAQRELREAIPRANKAAKAAQKEDMDTLKKTMKRLNRQLVEMGRSESSLRNSNNHLKTSESKLKNRVANLENELAALKAKTTEEMKTLSDELYLTQDKLKSTQKIESDLKDQNELFVSQISSMQNQIQDFSDKCLELQGRAEEARIRAKEALKISKKQKQEIKDLEAHCAHLKSSKDALENEREQMVRAQRSNSTDVHIKELEMERNQTAQELESLRTRANEYKQQTEKLREENEGAVESMKREHKVSTDKLRRQITRLTTLRNRFKRKAESLSSTVKTLMRDKATSEANVGNIYKERLTTLQKEKKAAMQALETYKRALEHKMSKPTNKIKNPFTSNVKLERELITMKRLANGLSETINDKDEVIVHMRRANKMLGTRIQALEKQLKIYEDMAQTDATDKSATETEDTRTVASASEREFQRDNRETPESKVR